MRRSKISKKYPRKFRILLDSAFAKSNSFPKLKRRANIAHAVHDCGLSKQAEDVEIYQKAIQQNRFVLTVNFKDFKKLVREGKVGIIGIESQLSNDQVDKLVTSFLSGKDPQDFIDKAIKLK